MDHDVLCQVHSKCLASGEVFQIPKNDEDLKICDKVSPVCDNSTPVDDFGSHSSWALSLVEVAVHPNQKIRPEKVQKTLDVFQLASICRQARTCNHLIKDVDACRHAGVDFA